jgi:myo-inositol-1(or 4)-monophosphatase
MMDNTENITEIQKSVRKLVYRLGDILLEYRQKELDIRKKNGLDIVTNVDLLIEKEIVDYMKDNYPEHRVVSEEKDYYRTLSSSYEDFVWIVDPLDGTINYVSGLPYFSISMALQKNQETHFGIIYAPALEELYLALRGKGSFLNDKRIRVSTKNKLEESVLSFMMTSHYNENEIERIIHMIRELSLRLRGLRLLVSLALELGYVASGRLEGTLCIKSRGFSSAGGVLLVEEAGGFATDISGSDFKDHSTSMLVTNRHIHQQVLEIISKGEEVVL